MERRSSKAIEEAIEATKAKQPEQSEAYHEEPSFICTIHRVHIIEGLICA